MQSTPIFLVILGGISLIAFGYIIEAKVMNFNLKQILRQIKKYFTIWWIPIAFYLIPIAIFLLGTIFQRNWIIDLSLIVFFLNIIGTLLSAIIQLIIGKWYFAFLQLGLVALLFFYSAIILPLYLPDYYGSNKEIPENIDFSEPLDSLPTQQDFELYDLILVNYSQPGIYKYYTDYTPKETGSFYIKAFEITSNDKLSEERIKKRSKISVDDLTPQRYEGEFTIYEGSWGDKYGSRIELWFQPSNGKDEYKVAERNYIVEGWMR